MSTIKIKFVGGINEEFVNFPSNVEVNDIKKYLSNQSTYFTIVSINDEYCFTHNKQYVSNYVKSSREPSIYTYRYYDYEIKFCNYLPKGPSMIVPMNVFYDARLNREGGPEKL